MAFSWKEHKKRRIRRGKRRIQYYLKQGMTMEASDLKRKVERMEKDALS